ncbi:MAG: MerR family transcriptional regulator [Propionibacteriaceae bacterium]|nr:MerR family transcriptional regulator [Propionibacteriaceae bacterium]
MDNQDTLFEGDFSAVGEDIGYRGPVACAAAGISYRQLDYWARTALVVPQIRAAEGSGTQRLYSFRDILMLKVVKKLIDAGISLQQIRLAVSHLRSRGNVDVTATTLLSDGTSVFECTQDAEIIDLVKGGQAMFAIDLSGVWHDLEGTLVALPTSRAQDVWTDELSERRKARHAA